MLGLPSVTLMAACSKPEDFVNNRTNLFLAALAERETKSPAPAAAVVRKKSRRVESEFILFVRGDRGLESIFAHITSVEDGVVYCERRKPSK